MIERLNRRHKAGLFFTVLATAGCLVAGVAWRESFGVALLGLALTWLVGALKPIHVLWAVSLTGLLLALGSVGWQYDDAGSIYGNCRILYDGLADTAKYEAHDPRTGEKEYWDKGSQRWLRFDQQSRNIEYWDISPKTSPQGQPPVALIPGTMAHGEFAAYLKDRIPELASAPDDELVEKVLKRRPELHFDSVSGEIVAQADNKGWALLARPASLRAALHEQWALVSVGMAAFIGGLVGVWLARRHIKA